MGTCSSCIKSRTLQSRKLVSSPTMVESPMNDNNLVPVINPPELFDENCSLPEKPSVLSPSTKILSESPIKENSAPATADTVLLPQVKSRWSFSSSKKSFGSSKDDSFFDSYQWLQSDSEDDFHSVNGDFTPSVGNTPKCSFSEKLPRFHNPLFEEEKNRVTFAITPKPRRKKLGELFRESIREEREATFEYSSENLSEESKKPSSDDDDDDNSGELKVIEDSGENQKKNLKSLNSHHHHRCLPRLSTFKGSLMEKRKRKKKNIYLKGDGKLSA